MAHIDAKMSHQNPAPSVAEQLIRRSTNARSMAVVPHVAECNRIAKYAVLANGKEVQYYLSNRDFEDEYGSSIDAATNKRRAIESVAGSEVVGQRVDTWTERTTIAQYHDAMQTRVVTTRQCDRKTHMLHGVATPLTDEQSLVRIGQDNKNSRRTR